MNSDVLKRGRVNIRKENRLSLKFMDISQGAAHFHGGYSESPDGIFTVAYADGHCEGSGDQGKWINGQVHLVKDNDLLWTKQLERPNDCAVSDNGVAIVEDWLRSKKSLGGKICIFDSKGELLFEKQFESNLSACGISRDGKHAVFSTAFPDNSIYLIDVESRVVLWRFKNTAKRVALGLSFSPENNEILVSTGQTSATKGLSYALTLTGVLSRESAEELNKIQQITHSNGPDPTETLLEFLLSTDPSKISKGLETLQSALYKKNVLNYQKIIPSLLSIIESNSLELSKSAMKIALMIGKKSPTLIESISLKIIAKCTEWLSTPYESENGLMTLGELGALNADWAIHVLPLIMDRLQRSEAWNERRFATFAIGQIGKTHPELIRDATPILARYLGDSAWWLHTLKDNSQETFEAADLNISISINDGVDPEVWLRDAALGVLGDIGAEHPDMVKDFVPMIILCLQRQEPYTRKRALTALCQIAQTNVNYITPIIPTIERIAEIETDPKVKSEARRILETFSPKTAERSVANVSDLIANLSIENKVSRYRSIQELERLVYSYSASLPQKYQQQVLLLLSKSPSILSNCVQRIREDIKNSNEEKTRWLLMESLIMAKRTFLDFIVAEYLDNGSFRCKLCNREFSRGGLRNHLSKSHPETWQLVRPYNDETLQYLNTKNQSGLSYEDWERQLLQGSS